MAITRLGPNQDITAAKIAGQINFKNLIINGDMSIAQRGTSSTSSAYATVDRFYVSRDGTSATQSQETLSSSDSPYSLGLRNYYRLTNTGTSSATSSYIAFNHKIEAQNLAKSGWEYTSSSSAITLSFWVRSSLSGTYYGNARTDDGSPDYNYAFPITLSANTWTKITKTIYGNSNLTINNDNGNGLSLIVWLHLGTDYTTSSHTINQWNVYSSTDQAPDFSQNWRNTASATFDITGVQLEVGTSASDFEFLPYDVNLQRCQRYFEILSIKQASQENEIMNMISFNASQIYGTYQFRVEKRNDPSLTVNNGTNYFRYYRQGGYENFSNIGLDNSSLHQASLYGTGLSLTSGEGGFVRWVNNASTNDKIAFDSEL